MKSLLKVPRASSSGAMPRTNSRPSSDRACARRTRRHQTLLEAFSAEPAPYPIATVVLAGPALKEQDAIVARWFDRHACAYAIVRPDRYVYGVATTLEETNIVLDRLHATLLGAPPAPAAFDAGFVAS